MSHENVIESLTAMVSGLSQEDQREVLRAIQRPPRVPVKQAAPTPSTPLFTEGYDGTGMNWSVVVK